MPQVTGAFTATGQSSSIKPHDNVVLGLGPDFNVSIWGTFVGTVQLERSFDGATWLPLTAAGFGLYAWTAPASEIVSRPESGFQYRLNCTAWTSGTINYRVSQ